MDRANDQIIVLDGIEEEFKVEDGTDLQVQPEGPTLDEIVRIIESPEYQRTLGKNSLLRTTTYVEEPPAEDYQIQLWDQAALELAMAIQSDSIPEGYREYEG